MLSSITAAIKRAITDPFAHRAIMETATIPIQPVQPAAQEFTLSFLSDIEAAGKKIGDVLTEIVTFGHNIKTVYSALSGPTLAASAAVFYDVVKTVSAAESAASAAATGNVSLSISLSETTIGLVKNVVTDFKSGEATIVADFKALNIKL